MQDSRRETAKGASPLPRTINLEDGEVSCQQRGTISTPTLEELPPGSLPLHVAPRGSSSVGRASFSGRVA